MYTLCTALIATVLISDAYILRQSIRSTTRLELFQGLFGGLGGKKTDPISSNTAPSAGKAADAEKLKDMKTKLAKIGNTQNRDYEAEAKKRALPPPVMKDKQIYSFNFNKPNEFPNLFKGWLKKDGDQIAKQIVSSTKAALTAKEKYIEILFDPVPNLDEVAFGSDWNKKFRMEVATNLMVPDYATNRGGPATLEWSNIYWANRIAAGLGSKENIVALSISGEGIEGKFKPTLANGMRLMKLTDARKGGLDTPTGAGISTTPTLLIILSPCLQSHYKDIKVLGDKLGIPVLALNSPYSYLYDIGGGKPFTLAYVMKRIPKGWVFRQFPKPFEAIIEGTNYEVFRAQSFDTQPKLTEISKVSTAASIEKYGAVGNDRIFQQRL